MRIGIDLGGTKTEAIALDGAGRELSRVRVPTERGNYAQTLRTVADLVRKIEDELDQSGSVGVAIPGTIVAATGLVRNANSTWLNRRPLGADLSSTLGREVRCANDANCFVLSEATDGAAKGMSVVFGAILGTGCGGGIAIDARVHAGPHGLAGEWGHTPLPWPSADENPGPSCYCGRSGCLETWISGPGFERDFQRATHQTLAAKQIVTLAETGNLPAKQAFDRLQDRIARGLAAVVDILDPDAVVLGGGLSNAAFLYSGSLEKRVASYTFGGSTPSLVLKNLHGDSSGVRGAAWLWPAMPPDREEERAQDHSSRASGHC